MMVKKKKNMKAILRQENFYKRQKFRHGTYLEEETMLTMVFQGNSVGK